MANYYVVKGLNEFLIVDGSLKLQDGNAIDSGTIEVSVDAQPTLTPGSEVTIIQRPTDGSGDVTVFAGRVSRPMDSNGFLQMDIESYSAVLNNVHAAEIYNNKSPEYIAQDLITKYTDLTYSSTAASGLTITEYVVNNDTIYSALTALLNVLGSWQMWGDFSKKFYFEPKIYTDSGQTFTVGTNCYVENQWDRNPDNISNMLILTGGKQTFNTTADSFTAAGGETTKALSFIPDSNFRITDNGTQLLGGLDTSVSSPDYTVDAANLLVTFTAARTAGHTIAISYAYVIPVYLESRGPEDSITTYGEHEDKLNLPNIITMADARSFAESYFTERAYPTLSNQMIVADNVVITQGQLATCVDAFSNVNSVLNVQAKKFNFADGTIELTVGTRPFTDYNLQKNTQARLAALESQVSSNSNMLQQYNQVQEYPNISLQSLLYAYDRNVYDTFFMGIGIMGTTPLGDRREGDVFDGTLSRWTVSGSVTVTGSTMKMDASSTNQTALYISTSSFSQVSGKIVTDIQKSGSSGTLSLLFRYVDSSNYYSVVFDFSANTVTLKKTVAGSTSTIGSAASYSFNSSGDKFAIRYSGTTIIIYSTTTTLVSATDSSITATGNVEFLATGAISYVQDVIIYTEVT